MARKKSYAAPVLRRRERIASITEAAPNFVITGRRRPPNTTD